RSNITRVDAVLYTHAHADHILGTDDLRAFNYVNQSTIPCYGTALTLESLRKSFEYIFNPDPNYEGGLLPQLDLHAIGDRAAFDVAGVRVQPFPLQHGKTAVLGFRF